MYTENEYYGGIPKSNIVSHSFRGTTWQKGDHKYTQRKKINGKYQYTYSNGNSTLKIESDFDVNDAANNLKNALTGTANMIDSEANRYKNKKKKEKVKITTKTYDRTPSTSSSNNKKYYEDYPVIKNKKENKEYFDRLEKQRKQEEWEKEASRQKAAYEERQKINKKLKSRTYRLKNAAKPKINKLYNNMLDRARKQDKFVNDIKTNVRNRRKKRKMKKFSENQVIKHGYLLHSAKGSTWSKSGAKYDKRYWKNGKWYYVYGEKMKQKAQNDEWRRKQREKFLKEGEQHRHEQYLKDQQIAKNRERQAKILKGKTGGVVNSSTKYDKNPNYDFDLSSRPDYEQKILNPHGYTTKPISKERAKEREETSRVYKDGQKYNVSDRKNNAKNKRPNVSVNSISKPRIDRSKWPEDSVPWKGYWNENRRKEHAADRAAKTKKLKSKTYQLKNKAEGKVRTLKKKISK